MHKSEKFESTGISDEDRNLDGEGGHHPNEIKTDSTRNEKQIKRLSRFLTWEKSGEGKKRETVEREIRRKWKGKIKEYKGGSERRER